MNEDQNPELDELATRAATDIASAIGDAVNGATEQLRSELAACLEINKNANAAIGDIANECKRYAAENAELRKDKARLIEDRVRFPDRPDDVGRMIEAHLGNLKQTAAMYEDNWRRSTIERDALRKDKERLDWLNSGNWKAERFNATVWLTRTEKGYDLNLYPTIRDAIDAQMEK